MSGPTLSGQPRTVRPINSLISSAVGPGDFALTDHISAPLVTSGTAAFACTRIDPAEWDIYERRLFFALAIDAWTGDTAPAVNAYLRVVTVTGFNGAATAVPILGTELARSATVAVNAANAHVGVLQTPLFEISAAGVYLPILNTSAITAAGSRIVLTGRLYCVTL